MRIKGKVQDVYPLSAMQAGIFFHGLYDGTGAAYFEQRSYRHKGPVTLSVFEKSLSALMSRYEVLRTAIVHEGLDKPLQVVLTDRTADLTFRDLSTEPDITQQLDRFKEEDIRRGFDLKKDPLLRMAMLQTGENEYEIIWSFHHILLDGWSLGILHHDLWTIYYALLQNRPITLPAPRHYSRYISWLATKDPAEARSFWKDYLEDYGMPVGVPGRKHTTGTAFEKGEVVFTLGTDPTFRLHNMAKELGVTFNTVIQVLWALLLAKYQHTQDVAFGAVVSGRPSEIAGIESMVGLFINTLPVRIRMEENTSLRELILRTQRESIEREPFQYLSLAEIQAESLLGPQLIDHILVFENYPFKSVDEQQEQTHVDIFTQSNYDLNVVVMPGEQLVIKLNYNNSIYDARFIERIPGHLKQLIGQLLENADRSIKDLDLLSSSEREYILHELNPQRAESEDKRSIKEQFEWHAERAPEAVCIREGLQVYSYGEVDALANRLAHYLQAECGLLAGDRVGVLQDRSAWLVISMLAVMKAGGVYVPADTAYPGNRKGFVFSDADVRVVLTVSDQLFSLSEYYVGKVFVVDSQADELQKYSSARLSTVLTSASPAYIIYTSGSTGQPKGVLVSNGALQNLCSWHCHAFGVDAGSRATLYAGVGFDASLWEVWPYLLSGASLYPFTEADRLDLGQIRFVLEGEKITHCFLPTPVCEQLGHIDCAGLILLTGGDRLQEVPGGNVRIVNNYGPTEGTVVSTSVFLEGAMKGAVPIGRPIRNTEAYVLDADGGLVPVGITGELYISGAHLSSGYINNIWLTQSRFVPHLYRSGELMYATGDLCRWGTDGQLYFMGRKDNQVKVRGYRIELGEIEQHLLSYEGITQAYVLLRERSGGEGVLIAYYTGSGDLSRQLLRSYLQGRLPSYMVPPYYVHLDEVPLTANGKVDRSAFELPEEFELRGSGEEKAGARTHEEAVLLEIWQELLGHDHIGIRDNFFEIGGHSLKAVQMITRIYKLLGVSIQHRDIFLHPTIEALGELISQTGQTNEQLEPVEEQDHYAVSHAQQRLWIYDKLELGASPAFNIPEAGIMDTNLDIKVVHGALESLIRRHESLRTVFREVDGVPRQKVLDDPASGFSLQYHDLQDQPDPLHAAVRLADKEALTPFDLQHGPLLRVQLLQLGHEQVALLFTIHHIVTDALSMRLLINELLAFINAGRTGQPCILPALRLQYRDYTAWHNGGLKDSRQELHRDFWLQRLSGPLPVLDFPADFPRPEKFDSKGRFVHAILPEELAEGIRALNRQQGSTLFITSLAIVYLLLQKYTGAADMLIGSPVNGRDHQGLDTQIGFFVNMLPFRIRASGNDTFQDLLTAVKQHVMEVWEHQAYPFDMLVNDLQLPRNRSRNPLFDVVVTADTFEDAVTEGDRRLHAGMMRPLEAERSLEVCKYDLRFRFAEAGGQLVINILYSQALFKHERILVLKERLINLIALILQDPHKPIKEFPLEAALEETDNRDLIIADFNF